MLDPPPPLPQPRPTKFHPPACETCESGSAESRLRAVEQWSVQCPVKWSSLYDRFGYGQLGLTKKGMYSTGARVGYTWFSSCMGIGRFAR